MLIGIALAFSNGVEHILSAILALVGAMLIQIGTNFYNDLADFDKGADTDERLGPRRVVHSGLVSRAGMKTATMLTFGLAVVSGGYLMVRGGWPIVLIGICSIVFGLLYTGGKYSLAYLGIADVFVLIFFGPVAVAGTYFVQSLTWPWPIWIVGIVPGLLAVAILLVNNIRDREQDAAVGKNTLIVRTSRAFGLTLYVGCLTFSAGVVLFLWLVSGFTPWILLALLAYPMYREPIMLLRTVPESQGHLLNAALAMTARNLLIVSVLFAVGIILGRL